MILKTLIKQIFGLVAMTLSGVMIFMAIPFQMFMSRKPFDWILLLSLIPAFIILNYGWKWFRNYYDMNEIPYEPGNLYAEKAKKLALADLDEFVKCLENGKNDCYIKCGLRTVRGGIEHIWCTAHKIESDVIWCSLANQPLELEEQYLKDRFSVPKNEIEDYVVMREDENLGGYSLMAAAETLRTRGFRIRPDQLALLKRHTAYKLWKFENTI